MYIVQCTTGLIKAMYQDVLFLQINICTFCLSFLQAESRQCGGTTGIVCCDNSANDGLPCLTNITQMFNNIKTVMEFRVLSSLYVELQYEIALETL